MMIERVEQTPGGLIYKDLRLEVLKRYVIRKQRVGEIAAELRKAGLLAFPQWEARKRVPQDEYRAVAGDGVPLSTRLAVPA